VGSCSVYKSLAIKILLAAATTSEQA